MKPLQKTVFVVYLITLTWLVLFKFSYDVASVLLHYQSRSFNLIPFATGAYGSVGEMLLNLIVFIPFGLLLGINLKQLTIWRCLAVIFGFSLVAEIIQFTFAIGTADITDVIMNTAGGFIGLVTHSALKKLMNERALDIVVTVLCAILLMLFILLRVFVFRVRY